MAQLKTKLIIEAVDRFIGPFRRLAGQFRVVRGEMNKTKLAAWADGATKSFSRLSTMAGTAVGALVGGGAAGGLGLFGAVIQTGAKFEDFQAQLEGTEGSADKAKKAMAWVSDFAAKTPYELDEVMESFVRLRAYGIDPTNGALRDLGDAAGMKKKPLMAAVEALADAQTGEFERLKEFGIVSSVAGNKVTFSWTQNGKQMQKTVAKTGVVISKAVTDIFRATSGGGMDRLSKTFNGMKSNLSDLITRNLKNVGDAGIFARVKKDLQGLLDLLGRPENAAKAAVWSRKISDGMIQVYEAGSSLVRGINWSKFISDLASLAAAGVGVVAFFAQFHKILLVLAGAGLIAKVILSLTALSTAFGVSAVAIGSVTVPIAIIIGGIVAIGTAVFLIYRNWGKITAWFVGMWDKLAGAFRSGVKKVWDSLPTWFQKVLQGIAFAVKFSPLGAPLAAAQIVGGAIEKSRSRPAVGAAGRAQVGGQIDLRVRGDGQATVTSAKSSNPAVPINVETGFAFSGF